MQSLSFTRHGHIHRVLVAKEERPVGDRGGERDQDHDHDYELGA